MNGLAYRVHNYVTLEFYASCIASRLCWGEDYAIIIFINE